MLRRKLHLGIAALLLLLTGRGFAQQDSQYTQYMYNTTTINPAYAGMRDLLSFTGVYRNQWVGLEGAPETLSFGINTPIGVKGVGLGLSVLSDKIGPTMESSVTADFSYTIPVSRDVDLAFGLKGGLNMLDVDVSKLDIFDPNDSYLYSAHLRSPIFGLGVYLYSDEWYIGLSAPNILETDFREVEVSTLSQRAHFYFIAGYVFDLNPDLKFKPALLTKAVAGAPVAVDISANFWFYETLSLGASYRFDAAVSALAAFQISPSVMLGYAYDYDTTALGNFNQGSHEVFLRFELGTRERKTFNTCYF